MCFAFCMLPCNSLQAQQPKKWCHNLFGTSRAFFFIRSKQHTQQRHHCSIYYIIHDGRHYHHCSPVAYSLCSRPPPSSFCQPPLHLPFLLCWHRLLGRFRLQQIQQQTKNKTPRVLHPLPTHALLLPRIYCPTTATRRRTHNHHACRTHCLSAAGGLLCHGTVGGRRQRQWWYYYHDHSCCRYYNSQYMHSGVC